MNDTETEVKCEWHFQSGIINFEGQEFIFDEGPFVSVIAKWLEKNLLSVEIFVKAEPEAQCARCLKPVKFEISDTLTYIYYLKGSDFFEDDNFLPVEIDYFGKTIDVMPQISESIFTLLPLKILCKDDCAGLCPFCGADLNDGPCLCKKNENIDPRFDALRNFVIKEIEE